MYASKRNCSWLLPGPCGRTSSLRKCVQGVSAGGRTKQTWSKSTKKQSEKKWNSRKTAAQCRSPVGEESTLSNWTMRAAWNRRASAMPSSDLKYCSPMSTTRASIAFRWSTPRLTTNIAFPEGENYIAPYQSDANRWLNSECQCIPHQSAVYIRSMNLS